MNHHSTYRKTIINQATFGLLCGLTSGALLAAPPVAPKEEAYAQIAQSPTWNTFPLYATVGYDQALRPQFPSSTRK